MVIAKGVHESIPHHDIIPYILEQNDELNELCYKDEEFDPVFVKKNRNPNLYNMVFRVSPAIYQCMMRQKRINLRVSARPRGRFFAV